MDHFFNDFVSKQNGNTVLRAGISGSWTLSSLSSLLSYYRDGKLGDCIYKGAEYIFRLNNEGLQGFLGVDRSGMIDIVPVFEAVTLLKFYKSTGQGLNRGKKALLKPDIS
ncbi:hypothetical protein BG000_001908 [Podila horticola]|nr:hypothetical protein BG000_001908 [Podila horticola]